MKIYSKQTALNADLFTPVEVYLKLRYRFRKICLLESNDYHSRKDSKSFIAFDPLVEITANSKTVEIIGEKETISRQFEANKITSSIQELLDDYEFTTPKNNGFFGRLGFEFNQSEETCLSRSSEFQRLPLLHLFIFRYILVIDHFTSEGTLIENSFSENSSGLDLHEILRTSPSTELPFETIQDEKGEFSDSEFTQLVKEGINHCKRGDVFQLVLSNEFQQTFFGDDFQVYRQLRRLNPSPYLFYFDFESYRLFGSSPEAQLCIKNGVAEIHPIAGTVPKTGDDALDHEQLQFLLSDEKENAEHTMLVDLARNDLSRDCTDVKVDRYKEVQHFSHVTHLVSKVTGKCKHQKSIELISHSFPAGTLSGTPKPKALELIAQYEQTPRDYYGGAIGLIGADGNITTAIVIRSLLSLNNTLYYRAGAGIVLDSDPVRETREVHHKLRVVRKAIALTQTQFQTTKNTVK